MIKYKETYINTDGDRIISSNGVTEDEIDAFESEYKDEINWVTEYISEDAKTIHMNDGSRYEYERSEQDD